MNLIFRFLPGWTRRKMLRMKTQATAFLFLQEWVMITISKDSPPRENKSKATSRSLQERETCQGLRDPLLPSKGRIVHLTMKICQRSLTKRTSNKLPPWTKKSWRKDRGSFTTSRATCSSWTLRETSSKMSSIDYLRIPRRSYKNVEGRSLKGS